MVQSKAEAEAWAIKQLNKRLRASFKKARQGGPVPEGYLLSPQNTIYKDTPANRTKLDKTGIEFNRRYSDSYHMSVREIWDNNQQIHEILNLMDGSLLIPRVAATTLDLLGGWTCYYRVSEPIDNPDMNLMNMAPIEYGPVMTERYVSYNITNDYNWFQPFHWTEEVEGGVSDILMTSVFRKYSFRGVLVFVPNFIPKPQAKFIVQRYKHGNLNCIITPIINKLNETKDLAKSQKYIVRLQSYIDYLTALDIKNGLSVEDIKTILKDIPLHIIIKDPFNSITADIKHVRPIFKITYINTYFDHVEQCTTIEDTYIPDKEFDKITINIGDLYTTSSIYKPNLTYKRQSSLDYHNFMINNNIDKLEGHNLINYVENACHHSGTIIYTDQHRPTAHIDKINAYAAYPSNEFYPKYKFPATRPQIMMKLPPNFDYSQYPGFYQIDMLNIIDCNDNIQKHFHTLNYYWRDTIYTAPELAYYQSIGCKFNILSGCFCFERRDISIDPATIPSQSYKKYIGMLSHRKQSITYKVKSDKKLCEILSSKYDIHHNNNLDGSYICSREITREGPVRTGHHIAAYILSYSRISILQQLFSMDHDDIIHITNDDIYYKNIYELKPGFRSKPVRVLTPDRHETYINDKKNNVLVPEFDPIFLNKYILLTGAPGTGKSHMMINAPQIINCLYVSDADKLNALAHHNFETLQRLTTTDKSVMKTTKDCAVMIADECYKYNDQQISLLQQRNPYSVIYWCGDPCQLPCIRKDKAIGPYVKYSDMYNIHLTDNYRIKCDYLANILSKMRLELTKKYDDPKYDITMLNTYVERTLRSICAEVPISEIKDNDVVITSTHEQIQEITTKLTHLKPKYYVNRRKDAVLAGTIIDYEIIGHTTLQHAFTVHSYQGATIKKQRLIIDFRRLFESNMLYVMLSRVEYLNQIYTLSP